MQNECIDDLDAYLRRRQISQIQSRPAIVVCKFRCLFKTLRMPLEGYRVYFLDRDERGEEVLRTNCLGHKYKPEEVVGVAELLYQEEIGLRQHDVFHIRADFGYDS